MKKIYAVLIVSVTLFLVSCNQTTVSETTVSTTTVSSIDTSNVPVYQGMEFSDTNLLLEGNESPEVSKLALLPSDFSYFKLLDTTTEVTTDIITTEVLPETTTITSETSSNITVLNQVDHFSQKNTDIFLTIHINNPLSYEILSFTLNGTKYQSYQFEDGSDSQNLILKVNSGSEEGVIDFTIDQIKYVDGTEIKDVLIEGNQTIKLGVTYSDVPYVTINETVIGTNDITIDLTLNDVNQLINQDDAYAMIEIYDGEDLVHQATLTSGDHSLFFDSLSSAKVYSYTIYAYCDVLDGNGYQKQSMLSDTFTTNQFVDINSVIASQDAVSFNIDISDSNAVGEIADISLYKDEIRIQSLSDLSAREFSGLLSNATYQIQVTYAYHLNDVSETYREVVVYEVTTVAKTVPRINLVISSIGQDQVTFAINFVDPDSLATITSIGLIYEDDIVQELTDFEIREFTGLLLNENYSIGVSYDYDLNDGVGVQSDFIVRDFKTLLFYGSGTESAPYEINNMTDFLNLDQLLGDDYLVLNTDIDLSSMNYEPIQDFSGKLDGKGHTISGLNYQVSGASNTIQYALFINNHGEIINLNVENVSYDVETEGNAYIAAIAINNYGLIENVYVSVTMKISALGRQIVGGVAANNGEPRNTAATIRNAEVDIVIETNGKYRRDIGGLAGTSSGFIDNSKTYGSIDITADAYVGEISGFGGIIGLMYAGTIQDSSSHIDITAERLSFDYVTSGGGIIGSLGADSRMVNIHNVYASGNIIGTMKGGGLIGTGHVNEGGVLDMQNVVSFGDVTSNVNDSNFGMLIGGLNIENYQSTTFENIWRYMGIEFNGLSSDYEHDFITSLEPPTLTINVSGTSMSVSVDIDEFESALSGFMDLSYQITLLNGETIVSQMMLDKTTASIVFEDLSSATTYVIRVDIIVDDVVVDTLEGQATT